MMAEGWVVCVLEFSVVRKKKRGHMGGVACPFIVVKAAYETLNHWWKKLLQNLKRRGHCFAFA